MQKFLLIFQEVINQLKLSDNLNSTSKEELDTETESRVY